MKLFSQVMLALAAAAAIVNGAALAGGRSDTTSISVASATPSVSSSSIVVAPRATPTLAWYATGDEKLAADEGSDNDDIKQERDLEKRRGGGGGGGGRGGGSRGGFGGSGGSGGSTSSGKPAGKIKLSKGVIIGISVAGVIALVLAAISLFCFIRHRRRSRAY